MTTRAVYLAMTAVLSFGSGLIVPAYVVYYVRTAGLGPLELVLVGTVLEASYFLSNVPTGAFADNYGRRWAIVLGVGIVGLGWFIQALTPAFVVILIGAAVGGLGSAFENGATDAWIADEVGDKALPGLFGRAAQVQRLAYLAGLGGAVGFATSSYAAPMVAGAAVSVLVALGLALVPRSRIAPPARPSPSRRASPSPPPRSSLVQRSGASPGPLYRAWLTGSIEPRVRATVLSMHSLCNAGGQIAGGPVIGIVGSLFSIPAALVTGTLFLVPNVWLYMRAGGHSARAAALPADAAL